MKAGHRRLVEELVDNGVLKTPSVVAAFRAIDRADFVLPFEQARAYVNEPLFIGEGQTISQPWTVAFMIEHLAPLAGERVLDIGSGSGWQTALLAQIVGEKGKVIGIERIPELVTQSKKSISKYNFLRRGVVEFHCLNGAKGYPPGAPYERIISAASLAGSGRAVAAKVPPAWLEQLAVGGRFIGPVDTDILLIEKLGPDNFRRQTFPGFAFVPFINENE